MHKPRILIVEDQLLISTNIRLLLKFNNYEVFGVAQNAEEAFKMLENERPDLILMDIALPGDIDGIDIANEINKKWNIPLIYITAKKDRQTLDRAKVSSPYGYLTKDVELKEQLPLLIEFALYKFNTEKEQELQRQETIDNEEKFRSIASSAQDAIIFLDNKGLIIYWNESATRIFGFNEKEILNKSLAELIAPKGFYDYYNEGFTDFGNDGNGIFIGKTLDLEVKNKNSENLPIEASFSSVKLKGNWCACCIIRDISERKASEKVIKRLINELQSSKDSLEQRNNEVMALNEKLTESEKILKELNASKDRFFSIIAHDLKGPFQGLIGYSDILSQDIESLSKNEVAEYSRDMNESARQIFKLLENLLDWTRIQRNAIEINLANQNLRMLVSMCVDILLLQANKKEIKIINNVDDSHVAYVDVNMMNTVIRNLISNAIKFTRIGGKIELSSTKIDDKIELVVSDNGVGIDEEALSKLFRIDVQHTTKGTADEKGTGLGLILCKEMVEKNGGSLRIESKLNEGTSFYITLESEKE